MKIYPAIDLKDGRCVRLFKGRFDDVTVYEQDPVSTAVAFARNGAEAAHVVDLDGAKDGESQQRTLIAQIVRESNLEIQSGGGIRSDKQAKRLAEAGVARIVLGSLAVQDPGAAADIISDLGPDKITLAVDVRFKDRDYFAAVDGWTRDTDVVLWDLVNRYREQGVHHLLCTDINLDGTMQGPNVALYADLQKRYPDIEVQASGGIGKLDDLKALSGAGVRAAIVGKALWEGKFTLAEALTC